MKKANRLVDVILLQSVERLGGVGHLASVRPGYFRNYLGPQLLALRATQKNKDVFEEKKERFFEVDQKRRLEAENLGEKVQILLLSIHRAVTPEGVLYGSVGVHDILTELHNSGLTSITRNQIKLTKAIKELGEHKVSVHLHPQVQADLSVVIDSQL